MSGTDEDQGFEPCPHCDRSDFRSDRDRSRHVATCEMNPRSPRVKGLDALAVLLPEHDDPDPPSASEEDPPPVPAPQERTLPPPPARPKKPGWVDIPALKREVDELQQRLRDLPSSEENSYEEYLLRVELETLTANAADALTRATDAEATTSAMAAEVTKLREELNAHLANKGAKTPRRTTKMAVTLAQVQNEITAALGPLLTRIGQLETDRDHLRTQVTDQGNRLTAVENSITTLTTQVNNLRAKVDPVDFAAMQAALATLQTALGGRDLGAIQTAANDAQARIGVVEHTITNAVTPAINAARDRANDAHNLATALDPLVTAARDRANDAYTEATDAATQATNVRDTLNQRINDEVIPRLPAAGTTPPATGEKGKFRKLFDPGS